MGRMTSLHDFDDQQVLGLPLDLLGMSVVEHCEGSGEWNSHNFRIGQQHRSLPARKALAEAMNWAIASGLIAREAPDQSGIESIFVTRAGKAALSDGLGPMQAAARLGVDVHPQLRPARTQFLLGEYELAAFAAMRQIEIRVRQMSGDGDSLIGVKLMRQAFKPDGGALVDETLDPGEQTGLMELFAGAIGTFKNPPSHRQVDYDDPTEASEVVLLADLLMRLLDRLEAARPQ